MPTSREEQTGSLLNKRMLLEGILIGAAYGLLLRASNFLDRFHWPFLPSLDIVMTAGFIFVGPTILGFFVIQRAELKGSESILFWIFAPWISVLMLMTGAGLLLWEGVICILMATPAALLCSSIGGVIAGLLAHRRRPSTATTMCIAFLPIIIGTFETHLQAPTSMRVVETDIKIHATPQVIWSNIERVPQISQQELRPNWTHRIGFPRPVEATLSREGVGGVRHATFEHGVLFIETITLWEPEKRLAFTIKADSADIPPTTLDEHVTIGGRYFDVLDGEYRIEPLGNGYFLLHLTSHERLNTDFNGYAGLWTDAVMKNLQTSILGVIKNRCEHA